MKLWLKQAQVVWTAEVKEGKKKGKGAGPRHTENLSAMLQV